MKVFLVQCLWGIGLLALILFIHYAYTQQLPQAQNENEIAPMQVGGHSLKAGPFHDYSEALTAAKLHDRPIFLYFGATWCGPCGLMKQLFADPDVQAQFNNNYIACIIDVDEDRKSGKKLSDRFHVGGIPCYFILDKDGRELKKNVGVLGKDAFLKWLGS